MICHSGLLRSQNWTRKVIEYCYCPWTERQTGIGGSANGKDLGTGGFEIFQSQADYRTLEDRLTLCSLIKITGSQAGERGG